MIWIHLDSSLEEFNCLIVFPLQAETVPCGTPGLWLANFYPRLSSLLTELKEQRLFEDAKVWRSRAPCLRP